MFSARIARWLGVAVAAVSVGTLGGCAGFKRDHYWKNGFAYRDYAKAHLTQPSSCPDPVKGHEDAENWICAYSRLLKERNGIASTDAKYAGKDNELREARNKVINGYLMLADFAYGRFEGDYQDDIAKFNIGADMVNLGLTAASSITPPAALLGAAATGTQGVQHSVDKNLLNSQTRFVIANRMQVIRGNERADIMRREAEPVCRGGETAVAVGQQPASLSEACYTLEDALRDVQDYFYQGTIHRALQSIESETQKLGQATAASTQTAPQITSASATHFALNQSGTFQVKAIGVPSPKFSLQGVPPDGPSIDSASGILSWRPPEAGQFQFTIVASNGVGSDAKQSFTLTVP